MSTKLLKSVPLPLLKSVPLPAPQYYQSPDLLVCDEIGYLPLGRQGSNLFFQVISARHEKNSTIITTNLPFAEWGNIFDGTTAATAIADRLVYSSEILILEGKSYRKRQ